MKAFGLPAGISEISREPPSGAALPRSPVRIPGEVGEYPFDFRGWPVWRHDASTRTHQKRNRATSRHVRLGPEKARPGGAITIRGTGPLGRRLPGSSAR
jgi:hypothetical protein